MSVYNELKDDLPLFLHLNGRIKKEGLDKQDVTDLLDTQTQLRVLRERVDIYNKHIGTFIQRNFVATNKKSVHDQ
jgi:hypothetical protein